MKISTIPDHMALPECRRDHVWNRDQVGPAINIAHGFHKVDYLPENDRTRYMISAVVAREGHAGNWRDLGNPGLHPCLARLAGEQDPQAHWLAPVHYWWPVTRRS